MDKPEIKAYGCVEFKKRRFFELLMGKRKDRLLIDGVEYEYDAGAWACWVPALCLKLLFSREGKLVCRYPGVPAPEALMAEDVDLDKQAGPGSPYTYGDWRRVYEKSMEVRVAELWIASWRLYKSGLGPRPLAIFKADKYIEHDSVDEAGMVGIFTEDVTRLPEKQDASEKDVMACGVQVDRIKSCVRQQLNGYVVDLNSAVGVVPVDAQAEVMQIAQQVGNFRNGLWSDAQVNI